MSTLVAGLDEPTRRSEEMSRGFCECGCGQKTSIVKQNIPERGLRKGDYLRFVHRHWRRGRTTTGWDQPCEICGTPFRVTPADVRKAKSRNSAPPRYCSLACRSVAYAGPGNPKWRGGSYIQGGYRMVKAPPDHPYAHADGYIQEHRLVMERHIGRILEPHECVHHFNHDRLDNRVENLELMTWSQHQRRHGYFEPIECSWCGTPVMRSRGWRRRYRDRPAYCGRKCAAQAGSKANADAARRRNAS